MKLKSALMITLGAICLCMGAIGLILPIWPTTPFVLCAVGLFSVHPRLQARLLKIKFIQEYSDNYKQKCGLSKKTVIKSLAFLWSMLLISFLITGAFWLIPLFLIIGLSVTVHIIYISKAKL